VRKEAPVFRNLSLMAGILLRPDNDPARSHVSPRVRCGDSNAVLSTGHIGTLAAFMPSSEAGAKEAGGKCGPSPGARGLSGWIRTITAIEIQRASRRMS
jgi:hypothetical protein